MALIVMASRLRCSVAVFMITAKPGGLMRRGCSYAPWSMIKSFKVTGRNGLMMGWRWLLMGHAITKVQFYWPRSWQAIRSVTYDREFEEILATVGPKSGSC